MVSKYAAAAGDLLTVVARTVVSPREILEFYRAHLWRPSTLPSIDHRTFLEQGADCNLTMLPTSDKYGDMTWQENLVVSLLVNHFKPRRVFEIGTFMGRTTYHLAANTPADARIFTLDLPETDFQSAIEANPYDRELLREGKRQEVGYHYKRSPFRDKVEQLFGDSTKFDTTPLENSMDFVLIDADHSYPSVVADTKVALRLLRKNEPGKVLLWHDLRRSTEVERAMRELVDPKKLAHIQETALGIYVS
jgi:predicted O-methyltransferase YrrM